MTKSFGSIGFVDAARGSARTLLAQLLVAVAAEKDVPFAAAFDHAALERNDLAPDDLVDGVALLFPSCDKVARLAQGQGKVGHLGQTLIAQPCDRLARQIKNSFLAELHRIAPHWLSAANSAAIRRLKSEIPLL